MKSADTFIRLVEVAAKPRRYEAQRMLRSPFEWAVSLFEMVQVVIFDLRLLTGAVPCADENFRLGLGKAGTV
jgi:hypothetical protein